MEWKQSLVSILLEPLNIVFAAVSTLFGSVLAFIFRKLGLGSLLEIAVSLLTAYCCCKRTQQQPTNSNEERSNNLEMEDLKPKAIKKRVPTKSIQPTRSNNLISSTSPTAQGYFKLL